MRIGPLLGFGFRAALVFTFFASRAAPGATFTVTNANDSGAGSLRQAVLNANATPYRDRIRFAIPGTGVHRIALASPLPQITDPLLIDGYSQPGSTPIPRVVIDGANAGAGADGLRFVAGATSDCSDCGVYSLGIIRFQSQFLGGGGNGIVVDGVPYIQMWGNVIGTDATGAQSLGNGGAGIRISNSSSNTIRANRVAHSSVGILVASGSHNELQSNVVHDNSGDGVQITGGDGNGVGGGPSVTGVPPSPNVVMSNGGNGFLIAGSATNTAVVGNWVGLSLAGAAAGNGEHGIRVDGTVGTFLAANVVSANSGNGILIFNGATGTVVQGNRVGVDPQLILGRGNALNGILVFESSGNTIGTIGFGNIVCGNEFNGIRVRNGSANNVVQGNLIGMTPAGIVIPNGDDGIELNDGATGNFIGGKAAGAGNVIVGNLANGIRLADATTTGNLVQGNRIGVQPSGGSAGNGSYGVFIEAGASGNRIGGAADGAGNTIAFNPGVGVLVESGTGNRILRNSVYNNYPLGIGLGPDLVTPNDPGDSDEGANRLQNYPVLTAASSPGAQTHIQGTLDGRASSSFRIEFFASDFCHDTGFGEGETWLGFSDVTTDASGLATFDVTLPLPAPRRIVTSTATDSAGNTSEFSACVAIPGPTIASITPASGPAEGGTAVTILGSNFQFGAQVSIGGVPATGVVVVSPTELTAVTPALPPGLLHFICVENPNLVHGCSTSRDRIWLADFADVAQSHLFHGAVEKIFRAAITSGCGGGGYCPDGAVNRASMAAFLLRGKHGGAYHPPDATGTVFGDVSVSTLLADWIEQLSAEKITTGCGSGNYCPAAAVNRASMAVFLLRAKHGSTFHPPAATGTVFADVPLGTFLGDWIERLAAESITSGCGGGNYCPDQPVTRGEMAVFLVRTFGL